MARRLAYLLGSLLLVMSVSAEAAWLQVCPATTSEAPPLSAIVTRPDGSRMQLLVSASPRPDCQGQPLPIAADQIAALHPLPPRLPASDTLLLQGVKREDGFAITSVSAPELWPVNSDTPQRQPLPLHVNLLEVLQARAFGVEERVRLRAESGRLQINCSAGTRPAGILLTSDGYLPRAEIDLAVTAHGSKGFAWQVADAALADKESSLPLQSRLAAPRQTGSVPLRLALPSALDRHAWRHFILVCPPQAATLTIERLELQARRDGAPPPRATWVWQAPVWQRQSAALLDWAATQRLGELFIAVPQAAGAVLDPATLTSFIERARAVGIGVWAVEGDPQMVLPDQEGPTLARARALARYNAQAAPPARLRGVQFDIEPYLLPGYALAPSAWEQRYLTLARGLRQASGKLPLEFVVPFWWGEKTALLRGLAEVADGLTVMDYRTEPREIYNFAVPFLDWASANRKQVRIALEAGPVGREWQRRYRRMGSVSNISSVNGINHADRGEAGQLWQLALPGALQTTLQDTQLLLLLKEAQPPPSAQIKAFALQGERVLDGSATSFHDQAAALHALLPQLERDFQAWPGFAGMALHELQRVPELQFTQPQTD